MLRAAIKFCWQTHLFVLYHNVLLYKNEEERTKERKEKNLTKSYALFNAQSTEEEEEENNENCYCYKQFSFIRLLCST